MRLLRSLVLLAVLLPLSSFSPVNRNRFALTRVVIDAGHGGHDVGCMGRSGGKEKDVALAVALKLGAYIESHYKDVEVIYTRKTDVFVELHERAAIANNANANLFICVHCNSACYRDKRLKRDICSEEAFGAESWVMGLNKSEANLEVSKRENEVVLMEKDYSAKYDGFDPNSPEANIIFSLYQNAFLDQSLKFASQVQHELKESGRSTRGVKQAGFLVLYKTTMPSVLIETGFLTNSLEEKYLLSAKGQDEIAHAVFRAFKSYKAGVDGGMPEEKPVVETVHTEPAKAVVDSAQGSSAGFNIPVQGSRERPADTAKASQGSRPTVVKPAVASTPPPAGDAVVYAVQILTSPSALPATHARFKGVEVWEDRVPGMYKYCTGRLANFQEAVQLQQRMKTKGFSDAFVVVYRNGERITLQEAKRNPGKP